nr:YybS family protein [Paenibacillus sp. sptzw28]
MNGLKTGLKSILWSAAALLLLLSIAVPVLNALVAAVLMVPTVILYTTLPRRSFILHILVVYAAAFAVMGPAVLIVGLFFLVPSIIMGHLYRKQVPARKVLTVTVVTLLAELLLELILFDLLLDFSLLREIRTLFMDTVNELSKQGLMPAGWTAELTDTYIQTVIHSIPMAIITVSFLFAVITHAIVRPILWSSGISVPGLQQAKDWKLPRIFVFYYLIALLADMATPDTGDSFMTVMLLNLVPLMRIAFSIQAMGLFFFIAHERRWHKAVPLLLSAIVVIFPPLSLIGVLDAGFPIRKAFKKP